MNGVDEISAWLRPLSSRGDDIPVGRDELGNTVYRTMTGIEYTIQKQYPQPPKPEVPASRRVTRWDAQGRAYHDSAPVERSRTLDTLKAAFAGLTNGFTAPGRALRGEGVTMGDVLDTAGMATLGTARLPSTAKNLASRTANLYDLPTKSEVGDVFGRSHSGGFDLEGRPLVARYVVGRAEGRVREQSLPAEALDEIAQATTGRGIEIVPQVASGRSDYGSLVVDRFTGRPLRVEVKKGLSPRQTESVSRHETGHLLDQIAGEIPVDGLTRDLEKIYSFGVEGRHKSSGLSRPGNYKYRGGDVPRELWAEAVRQYSVAPDTMKADFPKVAARIRKYINEHPELRNTIQFNSLAAGGVGLMAMPQIDKDEINAYLGGI